MTPQPFVPLDSGAQVEFIHTLFGETVECRLWFVSQFAPVDADLLQALALGASAWWRTDVLPFLSHDLVHQVTRATDWTSFPAPFTSVDTTSQAGGVAEPALSANVSIRVRFNGDDSQTFRDNSNFIPGIPRTAVVGNYYTSGIRDALFDAYVHLIDLTFHFEASHTWRWVITSRRKDYVYFDTQLFARTDIISLPSPVVSPRRHRMPS
jgi:hypothetical protein